MTDETLYVDKRQKENFIIQIQFHQNETWQGTLTWIDKKKTMNFRSTLEMIKLIDSAIMSGSDDDSSKWE